MHVRVLTLYPSMFPGPLGHGVLEKARLKGLWQLSLLNIRDFAKDAHQTVDDQAFGGGAGMVLMPEVVDAALKDAVRDLKNPQLIYLSPKGAVFNQAMAKTFTHTSAASCNARPLVLLCGRFEGVDQRVLDHWSVQEVSIGDFILMGGEVAAMTLIETCVRLLPGVLGNQDSLDEESFEDGLLEYPHFTRPRVWQERPVPDVLLSGHHEKIRAWRTEQRLLLTKKTRPDLWKSFTDRKGCAKKDEGALLKKGDDKSGETT
ncbi:MAG: tRNA (guanosine(37)-N1)-methyltransferase TrmD [Holosporaceae bacterium]